jgi:nucleotide-binding universal stress UspA family protein
MTFKHLIVHVDSSRRAGERIDVAASLARRSGARLTGLFAESDTLGASLVGRRTPDLMARAAEEARASFEDRARAAGIAAEWWSLEPAEYGPLLGQLEICCRYGDLAVFGQHEREDARVPEETVEHVVFHGGRPVIAVPAAGHYPEVGRRVLVGWNGSREAARALNDALPILEGAEEVHVVALQRAGHGGPGSALPPLDVVAHLAAHGIAAKYERVIVDGEDIDAADMLLNRSFDLQTDLTVVGGYAQHGLPGPRAGASTKKLLGSMTTPVLFSH